MGLKGNIDCLIRNNQLWPIRLAVDIVSIVIVDLFKGWLLFVGQAFQLLAIFFNRWQFYLFFVLLFHKDMHGLCLLIFPKKCLILFIGLLPFITTLLQCLYFFPYQLTLFLFLFFFQAFLELFLQGCFFCILDLMKSFYLIHLLLKLLKIFINLLDPLLASICIDIKIYPLINFPHIQLHIQPITNLVFVLTQLAIHNFLHNLRHHIISDLPDSIFQDLAVQLLIIDIAEEFSIV